MKTTPLNRSDATFLGALGLLKLLIHLPVLGRYGYHHDELYFLACGRHLSFGYVDHSPMVPWIARLAEELFGGSLVGLRIFSLLAGVAAVLMTGLLTRRLGGGRFAQLVACLAMIMAPAFLRMNGIVCIPAFEILFWIAGSYLAIVAIDEDRPRLWPAVGLMAGLGLMTKHSMLFFGFGLAVALVLTPARRHLRSPWLYLGGAIAITIFLPNLFWQAANVYYLMPAYPSLLAGGAILFEQWAERRRFLRGAVPAVLLASGLALMPLSLPIFSLETTERFIRTVTFGAFENVFELTGDMRGMFAWEERVDAIAEVYHSLPEEEREVTVLYAGWYGPAGAIDLFGPERGLPSAVSGHMTYHLWGLPPGPIETVIAVNVDPEDLREIYEEVTVVAELELQNVNPWDRIFRVVVCRRPKVDLREMWPETLRYH